MTKMIEVDYNKNLNDIFHRIANDNEILIKYIDSISYYKQGEWGFDRNKRAKRTDIAILKVDDIPKEILSLASLFIEDDNLMPIKYKIKIMNRTETTIDIKIKFSLINKLANLIFKLVRLKVKLEVRGYDNNTKTKAIIYYRIKSILAKKSINTIDDFIHNKLVPEYITKIDNYINNNL
jgi:hypothetical protein